MTTEPEIIFEQLKSADGYIGFITLNRVKQYNALNLTMMRALLKQLTEWQLDNNIVAVIIQAAPGKAFCAGGDLKALYDAMQKDIAPESFFREEYQLDLLIQQYSKPYIALLDGITMGGGAGISLLGSHRIASENVLFAMPETALGFFSDAGMTYHLSRLPHHLGIYLALTSTRLNYADCLQLKLVDTHIPQTLFPALRQALCSQSFGEDPYEGVARIVSQFSMPVSQTCELLNNPILNHIFSQASVEKIMETLELGTEKQHQTILQILKQKSPLSLKANLKILQLAEHSDFETCIQREFRLALRLLAQPDFKEGIRSVMIDKDQQPNWNPNSLHAISDAMLDALFQPFPLPSQELILK